MKANHSVGRKLWLVTSAAVSVVVLNFNILNISTAETVVQPSGAAQSAVVSEIDPEALRIEGQALIYATSPADQDIEAGIALLEKSAAAGNAKAKLTLGSLYLFGQVVATNRTRALEYFEEVAATGDGSGLAQFGMMVMWSEDDWGLAEATLVRAGEMGTTGAWATLAEGAMYGYLGGGTRSRAKFDGYAEKARAAGNTRIEVLDATRQMWGISMPADGPATLAKLRVAADAGNVDAAKYLISLQRDGNGLNVRKDRDSAADALALYAPLLTKTEIWQYDLSLKAARAQGPADYALLADEIMAHPEWYTKSLGVELRKANLNAAIYVLQARLKAKGLYDGPLDGLAGIGTIRAMNLACVGLLDPSGCDDNVLRPDVVSALIIIR